MRYSFVLYSVSHAEKAQRKIFDRKVRSLLSPFQMLLLLLTFVIVALGLLIWILSSTRAARKTIEQELIEEGLKPTPVALVEAKELSLLRLDLAQQLAGLLKLVTDEFFNGDPEATTELANVTSTTDSILQFCRANNEEMHQLMQQEQAWVKYHLLSLEEAKRTSLANLALLHLATAAFHLCHDLQDEAGLEIQTVEESLNGVREVIEDHKKL